MSASNVQRHWGRTNESARRIVQPSPLLRSERIRLEAARVFRATFGRRPAKHLAPYIAPQEVSDLRNRGGCIGKVAVLMLADPRNAVSYAEHLMDVARSVSATVCRPLHIVLSEEVRADVEEDVAQDDLRVAKSPDTLRNYIEKAKRARAKLTESIDAAERELSDMERGA